MSKAGIREQVGVAVNASVLELEEGHEHHLDRVAALGLARVELTTVRTGEKTRASLGMRDQIVGELAPLLWRAKYGRDTVANNFATTFFACWLLERPAYAEINGAVPGLVLRFARRAMHEWTHEICRGCGGTKLQERVRGGQPIPPRGLGYRNTLTICCTVCHGTGTVNVDPMARMRALSSSAHRVSWREYNDLWRRAFGKAQRHLNAFASRALRPLQSALDRL